MGKTIKKDRIYEIIEAVMKVARGDYSVQIELSDENDDIDSLAMGLNMMIDDLKAGTIGLEYVYKRTNDILAIIRRVAMGDYTASCKSFGQNDVFDELGKGINLMIDDIKENFEQLNISKEIIEDYNRTLEQKIKERTNELQKSEIRFRDIALSSADWIWEVDENGAYTYCSEKAEEILGLTSSEIIGKNPFEIMPFEDDELERLFLRKIFDKEIIKDFEHWNLVNKNGKRICISTSCMPITDEHGNFKGSRGVDKDITERKRTNELLLRSENKYRLLIENIPQKMFYKDRDSIYVSCNENYSRDLKIKPDEIVNKTDYDFFPEGLADKYKADDKRIMDLGVTEDIEEKYIQDGQEMWVHTIKTPVNDDKGNCIGILGIFWDITDRKQAEQEKEKLRLQLLQSEKMAAIGQLAGGIAHEINNPMGVILGFAQSIVKRMKEGDILYMPLKSIEREAIRCKKLVTDLLTFSRTGKTQAETTDINKTIEETLSLIEAQAKVKDVEIIREYAYDLPQIPINRNQLQQVIINLCNNAIDAM
ncbi:MAG: PAS domain S-box protein, partial [Bacteroidetes bacterium]|nr:PAS domain S-box protein [Bacteroidota bacterium]